MLEVVARIDDCCHAGAKAPLKPEHELGAADAAAKSDNFGTAAHRNRSLALLAIATQAGVLNLRNSAATKVLYVVAALSVRWQASDANAGTGHFVTPVDSD